MRKPQPPLTHHTETSEAMNQIPPPCRALLEPVDHSEGYRGPPANEDYATFVKDKNFSWSVPSNKSGGQRLEIQLAERYWSPVNHTEGHANAERFLPRYHYFRCLLNQRGVRAAPAANHLARRNPDGPGSCYEQR
jgi:hypothetical protein